MNILIIIYQRFKRLSIDCIWVMSGPALLYFYIHFYLDWTFICLLETIGVNKNPGKKTTSIDFFFFVLKKKKKTRHLCLFCASMGEKISTIAIRLSCMFVFWLSRILIRMNKKGFFMHALHWEKKSTNYNLSQSQKTAFVASTQEILDFPYWLPR